MSVSLDTHTMAPKLFVHSLRPQWGVGLLTATEPNRVRLQFEDGENRAFAKGYVQLLEPVDRTDPELDVERTLEKLMRAVGVSEVRQRMMKRGAGTTEAVPLDDQIRRFKEAYPKGFMDPKWIVESRGDGAKRRVKRHRTPSITDAQRILGRDRMKKLRDEGRSTALWDGIVAILRKSDLVSMKNDVRPAENMSAGDQVEAVRRLYDLLYEDGPMQPKYDQWIASLKIDGKSPSWGLATAIPALVQPDRHMPVRVAKARKQAKWMAPKLKVGREPVGRVYGSLVTMALAVKTSLEREGLKPRDLIDVADFINATC